MSYFYNAAKEIVEKADFALKIAKERPEEIAGEIRISTTNAFASLWISNVLSDFCKQNPSIKITIIGSENNHDLFKETDIAIRPKVKKREEDLEHIPLGHYKMVLCASEEYLEKNGIPQKVTDLKNHKIISYGESVDYPYEEINWHLDIQGVELEPYYQINSGSGVLQAVENGIGIGAVSLSGIEISSVPLVHILPEIEGSTIPFYFITHKRKIFFKRIQLLKEYLQDYYSK